MIKIIYDVKIIPAQGGMCTTSVTLGTLGSALGSAAAPTLSHTALYPKTPLSSYILCGKVCSFMYSHVPSTFQMPLPPAPSLRLVLPTIEEKKIGRQQTDCTTRHKHQHTLALAQWTPRQVPLVSSYPDYYARRSAITISACAQPLTPSPLTLPCSYSSGSRGDVGAGNREAQGTWSLPPPLLAQMHTS